MGHFAVNDRQFYPLFEIINALKAPVMIDVGTTGMGAGMPGGLGARIRHAHPSAIDDLAADFPDLTIIAAHPGWPWVDEMTAVALHKGNVFWEMSGWAPKYFPAQLKIDIRSRLQDKVMFGSDYPSIPYDRADQGMGRARLHRRRDGEDLPRQRRALVGPIIIVGLKRSGSYRFPRISRASAGVAGSWPSERMIDTAFSTSAALCGAFMPFSK